MNYTFLPNSESAINLRVAYQTQLKESYIEMLVQIEAAEPAKFSRELLPYFSELNAGHFGGFHSFIYHRSISLLAESNFDEVCRLFDLLKNGSLNQRPFVQGNLIDSSVVGAIFDEGLSNNEDYGITLGTIGESAEREIFEKMNLGLDVLKNSCLTLHSEIFGLGQSVMFFVPQREQKYKAFSFTSSLLQGLVLINGEAHRDWIFLLDKWIHEGAHAYLFAINFFEEMVLNDGSRSFSSPLRKDKRTMLGVFHATFVIQRLIYAFSEILKRDVEDEDRVKINGLLQNYFVRLDDGMATVRAHANLSPLARQMIEDGYEYATAVKAGEPA